MTTCVILVLLALVGCSIAFPVRPEDDLGPVVGVLVQPTGLDGKPREKSSPMAYAILLSDSRTPEDAASAAVVEKREANEEDGPQDLETAAGTYALRPLFVYRQQLAYRERVRQARRGNRF